MKSVTGRRLWRSLLLIALGWIIVTQASAASLSMADVQRLAVEHQPLLQTVSAGALAARERAISAGQLPDPQLKFGFQNLPVDTADAGRFNRDSMTQSTIGFVQALPLAGKRQLRRESESLGADEAEAQLVATTRAIERDAGLAYLDLLHPHHAKALLAAQIAEANRAHEAAEIAYRSGQRGQADVLAAAAAIGLLEDKAADFDQDYLIARDNLQRWIGETAEFVPTEPTMPVVPPLAELLANLDRHPELLAAERAVDRAGVGKQLAQQSKRPDLSVELNYGYRTDYSDMVSLQVGIPLPLFSHNRQDRDIAAAQADLDAQQSMREDLHRQLVAQLSATYHQWETLGTRLERYNSDVISPQNNRVDATLAEYRSGTGSFAAVLDARQALLDAQLSLLELHLQHLRAALKLRYFAMEQDHAQ